MPATVNLEDSLMHLSNESLMLEDLVEPDVEANIQDYATRLAFYGGPEEENKSGTASRNTRQGTQLTPTPEYFDKP